MCKKLQYNNSKLLRITLALLTHVKVNLHYKQETTYNNLRHAIYENYTRLVSTNFTL